MSSTGYGRTSSINRIPYYTGSSRSKGRTYRGVRTGKMVADMSSRLAKAQDTQMKNDFNNGNLSADQYNAYLTNRIAQTSDPTYRVTLTQELQNVVTGTNESQMLDGYNSGQVSADQVKAYYESKLAGLTPDNPEYSKTQAAIAKWDNTATTDAYKAQEAVLKSNESAATDQLPAAQKLLDFYVQYLQKLQPNSPEYNTTVQAIGTYQAKVRQMTFQQNLLKAEDKISQTYNKNTPEDWAAKAQLYQQLRDQAAQEGDTTNYYKYDEMANNATDAATKAQQTVNTKKVTDAINQVRNDYISGKIDGYTAQSQLQDIAYAADGVGDVTGSTLAHDMFNTVQNDINRGVTYGGNNGFGKTKGGAGGDTGWYDLSGGTPITGSVAKAVNSIGSTTSTATSKSSTGTPSSSGDLLSQLLTAAKVSNPTQAVIAELNNASSNGATFQDMVNILRVKKIGTGDGYKAIQDIQKSTAQTLNNALHLGYDPTTGLPFTIDGQNGYRAQLLATNTELAQKYTEWQNYIAANPKAKISLNGKNVEVGTLADNIDKTLNGTTKIDPTTGFEVKDTPGLLDSIATLSSPNNDLVVVEDPKNPGQFISASKANFEAQNGTLASKYIQDENGVWHLVNNPTPKEVTFSTNKEAVAYAKAHGIDPAGIGNSKGQFIVYVPTGQRNVTVQGPNGQKIMYVLNPDNSIKQVQATKGSLPAGFTPSKIMSFGGAQLSAPATAKSGFGQTLTPATQKNPANFSSQYGPRYASGIKTVPYSPVPNNTSTRNGATYTPPPKTNSANYSVNPNAQNFSKAPSFSPVPSSSKVIAPAQPGIFQNPLDVLISKIIPASQPVKPISIPANVPLDLNQSQQQVFSQPVNNGTPAGSNPASQQQNPASPSAPLSIAGNQPKNNITPSSIGNKQLNMGGPITPQPAPQQSNWFSNLGGNIGKTIDNVGSSIGHFFGGFHF